MISNCELKLNEMLRMCGCVMIAMSSCLSAERGMAGHGRQCWWSCRTIHSYQREVLNSKMS